MIKPDETFIPTEPRLFSKFRTRHTLRQRIELTKRVFIWCTLRVKKFLKRKK